VHYDYMTDVSKSRSMSDDHVMAYVWFLFFQSGAFSATKPVYRAPCFFISGRQEEAITSMVRITDFFGSIGRFHVWENFTLDRSGPRVYHQDLILI